MDLILFAGPVVVKEAHRRIDWYGRDVRIVPIEGQGSSTFVNLANSLRKDGRILPSVLAKYAKGLNPDKIVLASYSAGWGLWNQVAEIDEDRKRVTALCLSDSNFMAGDPATGACGNIHNGFVRFARDAMAGDRLMVLASAHTTNGTHLTGRQSVLCDTRQAGASFRRIEPRSPAPKASGGWWRDGQLYWGDYTATGSAVGQGNDFTHQQHHDLSAPVWQAYVAPWLAGKMQSEINLATVLPVAAGLAAAYMLFRGKK
jgi:hypothetical protein